MSKSSQHKAKMQRLQEIADEIKQLPDTYKNIPLGLRGELADAGGQLIAEAIALGAFSGSEHAKLRLLIDRQKRKIPSDWRGGAWEEAVACLTTGYTGEMSAWAPACIPIAKAVASEAENLAGQDGKSGNDRECGRPVKDVTEQRVEFAKLKFKEGLSWPEIVDEYKEKYPKDTKLTPDAMRRAYHRAYPRNGPL